MSGLDLYPDLDLYPCARRSRRLEGFLELAVCMVRADAGMHLRKLSTRARVLSSGPRKAWMRRDIRSFRLYMLSLFEIMWRVGYCEVSTAMGGHTKPSLKLASCLLISVDDLCESETLIERTEPSTLAFHITFWIVSSQK